MLNSHENFHSVNGKRRILVADDEIINREILGEMLKAEYDVIFACDGAETIELMLEHRDTLSLVLLDILMPVKSGLQVLKEVRADERLSGIPVIVMTAERKAEIESLDLGAIDFIPKPYPELGVILARIRRTIELSEDRDIILSTERDSLTGLYNKDFFYRYAQQYDQYHKDQEMDAIILDVNHFHMINERHGKAFGDEILKMIGEEVREAVHDSGGIVCRREADTFMVYCPHLEDCGWLLDRTVACIQEKASKENRIHLRMGVYSGVDKTVDMEQRFDRAKMAADTIKGSFAQTVAFYDKKLHEKELFAEQLIEEFPTAIAEKQFQVYYQPKFDIRPDTPVLASAEALVRWIHPKLGIISPGAFIPLFENNGLIQKLDNYVWEETAHQIADWKERLNYSVPVSVNMSRVDLFAPELAQTLQEILEKNGLTGKDFLLEVTESAYTQDSERIIEVVEQLREMGFKVEMDDFGTGYSSLHMISSLPIDALKLDMRFIRDAFQEGGNTHMLDVIIGIAGYLAVPVIAEGVETEEQLHALKQLGCDLVQGYFFSKPVPAGEFEPFILQKKEADQAAEQKKIEESMRAKAESEEGESAETFMRKVREQALRQEWGDEKEQSGDDLPLDKLEEKSRPGIHLRTATIFVTILALLSAAALMASGIALKGGYRRMEQASDRYIEAQMAASDMETGSDYLTDRVRCFVVTGEVQYLRDFIEEVEVTKRRDNAVGNLEKLLEGSDSSALTNLNTALVFSNDLVAVENRAMRLMVEAGDYVPEDIPVQIMSVELSREDRMLSPAQMKERAQTLVFDNNYMHYKDRIRESVRLCTQSLIHSSSQELEKASAQLAILVNLQTVMSIVFLLIVLGIVLVITQMVRIPLTKMVDNMQERRLIIPTGVEELRFVTRIYNEILQENKKSEERLSHEASHDALTGLFNRGAYDLWMSSADTNHIALILIDVDYFKSVNDTYGHAVGDRVLKRVADTMRQNFRSVDIMCRIGGDEFAVIMTRVNSSMHQLVYNKVCHINETLQNPKDDLPPISLSVGIAFSDRENPEEDIFRDADKALFRVKERGRNGCEIY